MGNSENRTWSKASDINGLQSLMKLLGWKKRTWSSKDGIVLSPTHFTRIYIIRAKRVLSTSSGLIISSLLNLGGVLPPPSLRRKINKICGENRGRLGDSYEKEE